METQRSILVLLILVLSGCAQYGKLRDISKCSVFVGSIQREDSIEKPCLIVRQKDLSYFHMVELEDSFVKHASEANKKRPGSFEIIELIQGDVVLVEEVNVESIYAGPTLVVAHGKVLNPGTNEWLDFEYMWSDNHLIPRAPWDGDEVEELRMLELNEDYSCKN